MPRYYFNVRHHELNRDHDGLILPDDAAAWEEAVSACAEMMHDIDGALKAGPEWAVEVTDERGEKLFAIKFSAEGYRPSFARAPAAK